MTLREALQSVYDKHGKLTADLVVAEARANHSTAGKALHAHFEWDDSVAANKWRREQASTLIRSITVVYRKANPDAKDGDTRAHSIRVFQSVATEDGYVYEPLDKVMENPFLRNLKLSEMEREWVALHERWQDFAEFADMVKRDLEKREAA